MSLPIAPEKNASGPVAPARERRAPASAGRGPAAGDSTRPSAAMPELGGPGPAIALTFTMFVEAVGYGVVAPTLPFLAREAGAGEARIGLLVGLYAVVGLLVAVPFGVLANRYGRRTLVLLGLACLTVASIGFVLAPGYLWLVAGRLAQGLGAAAIWVGALTVAADLSPDASMGRSLSWISGAWSLGFVVGPALGGIGSVRFPFVLYACLSAIALVVGIIALPETGRPGTRTTVAGILRVLRRPAVLISAAATFVLSFFYGAIEAFMPLLADQMNVRRFGIGILFAIAGMPSIILPRLAGYLADRLGDARLLAAGLAYTAILCAVLLPLVGLLPLWSVFLMIGFVEVVLYIPAVALLNRGMDRDDRIFAAGSHNYAFSTGFFLGPLIGGLLLPLGGYPLLFAALTVVSVAGMATLLAARGRIAAA